MKELDTFCTIIQDYIHLFEHLIDIETRKIEAVSKEQITVVEDCMNQEQAAVLKMRGLDLQREAAAKTLGFSELSFREIIEEYPKYSPRLLPLFQLLSDRIQTFRVLSDSAKELIQTNLHVINQLLSENSTSAYGQDGIEQSEPKHFTNRSV